MTEVSVLTRPIDAHTWDEAFRRVESYLCAHGVASRVQLNSLAAEIIAVAQQLAVNHPAVEPVTLAMEVADERIGAWLGRFLPAENSSDDRFRAHGRLAMVLADLPGRWSQHFLADGAVPPELVSAMREGDMQAGPAVRFTNMPPSPIEFPVADGPRSPDAAGRQGTIIRAFAMWIMIIGILGVTWAASH